MNPQDRPFAELTDDMIEEYKNASPFPHIVLDSLIRPKRLREIKAEIDAMKPEVWRRSDHESQVNKLWMPDLRVMPSKTRNLIHELSSRRFLSFLSDLTGIRPLLPDPTLEGGGLHRVLPGGKLDIHADFNLHPKTGFHRRLNVLLYLTPNWDKRWGGDLELWDKDMTRCVRRISPLENRMVIFTITDQAFHGHPQPLTCPQGRSRDAIALYYYTVDRPEHEKAPFHWAAWQRQV